MKRYLSIALCLVMVSAFAVTGAVSATQAGQSDVRQYNVQIGHVDKPTVLGKLTVKVLADGSGKYVINANVGRVAQVSKEYNKDTFPAGTLGDIRAFNRDATPQFIEFGSVTMDAGGNLHGAGTISKDVVDWLAMWGDSSQTDIAVYYPV